VSPAVIAIVLFAAVMNVSWHVVVKTSGDPLLMTARSMGGSIAVATPVVLGAWLLTGMPLLSPAGWALAVVSGLWELAYFVTVSAAYRRGDLSTVYPIARGTAALGAVVVGVAILGERPGTVALVGVGFLLAGGWFVRRPAVRARSSAVGWALLTGMTIVGYSAVDRVGAREGPPWLYGWAIFAIGAGLLWGWMAVDARLGVSARLSRRAALGGGLAARLAAEPDRPPSPASTLATVPIGDPVEAGLPSPAARSRPGVTAEPSEAPWGRAIVAGLLILGAYMLVLYAYSVAPLSLVSPLRESAVVLATAWGILGLGEREGAAQRLGGAALIALGGVLVAIG
jgi:drug/metabolite transporter (DMT)-like permease